MHPWACTFSIGKPLQGTAHRDKPSVSTGRGPSTTISLPAGNAVW